MIGTAFGTGSTYFPANPLGFSPYGVQPPYVTQGYGQPFSTIPFGIQSQQYAQPLQHILQLLQVVPQQLQQVHQLQQLQQQHIQQLQQLVQIVPQQLQQLQQLIQLVPQQIHQLQQQLQWQQQPLAQAALSGFGATPQVAGPFGWSSAPQPGNQVM